MWSVLSKHDSSSQSGNTLRILHYYKLNTLAIIIIYKKQRACRLIVTSRMSTNAGNRGIEANEYHTLCAAYRTTSLNTVSRNIIENSGENRPTRTA